MMLLFIATAAAYPYVRVAENSICGVPDADTLTPRSSAIHVWMILISIPGEEKGLSKSRLKVQGSRFKVYKTYVL
jgi:hypothetical protein